MPYRIKDPRRLPEEIRRIVEEQIDRAIREIDDKELDQDETVHQVRKRCKKVRAVLRLARIPLDDGKVYKRENVWFRDASRELSFVRDAATLIETYDGLMTHFEEQVDRSTFGIVRRRLTLRHKKMMESAIDERLDTLRARMETGRQRVSKWAKGMATFDALAPGLVKTYRRGREAMAAAYNDPSPERLHEWRKRTKYHWYHCRLLQEVWPEVMEARMTELSRLADILGDEHDLSVFRDMLTREGDELAEGELHEALLGLIDQRREDLRKEAAPLGARIFAEKPKHLNRRIGLYWKVWWGKE